MTRSGVQWLSGAAEDPTECRQAWQDDPRAPYVIPAGRLFDVVSVDIRHGMETFDLLSRQKMPLGPVLMDYSAERVGFLVPPRSRDRFARLASIDTAEPPSYRYLDDGDHVVMPGPQAFTSDRFHWLHAPQRRLESSLRRTAALALMLAAARDLLARADRYGEMYAQPNGFLGLAETDVAYHRITDTDVMSDGGPVRRGRRHGRT